ncbi:MAG TPA: outer membrane protein assembly factor BamE [Deltaproteobacteria bacterium]|nr:MAG: hypothetical protein DRN91_08890 [Candidatus Alkanophagales archaeon]HDM79309.1 outer membrane protein assembly factor BamE [Deltaproteobacteria bacterium]
MKKSLIFVSILAMVGFMTACGVISYQNIRQGEEITDEQLSEIKPGMSKDDVLVKLGAPTSVKRMDDGRKVYFYCWQRGGNVTVLWGTLGSNSAKSYCVTVIFDENDKVVKVGKGRGASAEVMPTIKIRKENVNVQEKEGSGEL